MLKSTAFRVCVLGAGIGLVVGLVLFILQLRDPELPAAVAAAIHKQQLAVVPPSACAVYSFNDQDNMDGVSLNVIETFEGRVPTLYVPADMSGPTIGFGLDLGCAGQCAVRNTLQGLVSADDLEEMLTAHGLHGAQARRWVAQHQDLKLDSCVMNAILQRQCRQYWHYIIAARPCLATAPSEVKTAALSFFMHLGTLEPFSREIAARDWPAFANKLETFNDSTTGDVAFNWKRRRHLEARLVRLIGTKPIVDSTD
jgi:GH24 family phage-related lysozyme (muramidase)